MKRLVHMLAVLGVALGGIPTAHGAPSPSPPTAMGAPSAKEAPSVKVAPSGKAGSEVRAEMKKILAGRDYRQLRREALRAKKKKKEPPPKKDCSNEERRGCQGCQGCGGSGAGAGGGVGSLASGLLYLVVMLAVAFLIGLIAWTIARHWKKERSDDDEEDLLDEEAMMPSTPPGEHPSSEYLRKALALSAEGDQRGAIRQLLLGCMSWIERNGLIRYRKGLTNRDYLRAVFQRQTQREGMGGIVTDFERIYFGRREATAERFKRCLSGFQAGFDKDEGEAEMAR